MKYKNCNTIEFDLRNQKAYIQLTPKIEITVTDKTIFKHAFWNGLSGFSVITDEKTYWISSRVMRVILKYLHCYREGYNCDYYKMKFPEQ